MPSIKVTSLVEPLLNRQQVAIVRDIARAVELHNAITELSSLKEIITNSQTAMPITEINKLTHVTEYLIAEVNRILMQIKLPKQPIADPTTPLTGPIAEKLA